MKFRDFQLPQKIKWIKEEEEYGKLSCEPFERGYGHTIGNSLRRILLASMEGAVITTVKVNNALHEYATLEGVKEDVHEIIFNLKQLRFKVTTEESQRITLEVEGSNEVTGKDFQLNESVALLNPSTKIATLSDKGKLYIEAIVERGRGYSLASDRQEKVVSVGEIPIDAAFSPIRKVNYDVENARVGQATDYDRLLIDIWTDGSVKPRESVAYAAQILKRTLDVFEIPEVEKVELGEGMAVEREKEKDIKEKGLEDLKISTRVENILKRNNIKTIEDMLEKSEDEILNIEKMGKKSLDEIKDKLDKLNKERGINLELKE